MPTRTVMVWERECEVSTQQTSKTVWVAVGQYMDRTIEEKARSESAALAAWKRAARYWGNV